MVLIEEGYVTIARAAEQLKVSRSTLWRWIKTGELPAYRLGQRRVLIKEDDLRGLIAPVESRKAEVLPDEDRERLRRPLARQEQQQALAALDAAAQLSRELLKQRGGRPFGDSVSILRALRAERSRQLQ
ncbi:MAG: excisionase family DNA-binding protein [Chloroflexi bacterium]|nr:excisionase family DNA-binding protein [Chloroflexota bacterium]